MTNMNSDKNKKLISYDNEIEFISPAELNKLTDTIKTEIGNLKSIRNISTAEREHLKEMVKTLRDSNVAITSNILKGMNSGAHLTNSALILSSCLCAPHLTPAMQGIIVAGGAMSASCGFSTYKAIKLANVAKELESDTPKITNDVYIQIVSNYLALKNGVKIQNIVEESMAITMGAIGVVFGIKQGGSALGYNQNATASELIIKNILESNLETKSQKNITDATIQNIDANTFDSLSKDKMSEIDLKDKTKHKLKLLEDNKYKKQFLEIIKELKTSDKRQLDLFLNSLNSGAMAFDTIASTITACCFPNQAMPKALQLAFGCSTGLLCTSANSSRSEDFLKDIEKRIENNQNEFSYYEIFQLFQMYQASKNKFESLGDYVSSLGPIVTGTIAKALGGSYAVSAAVTSKLSEIVFKESINKPALDNKLAMQTVGQIFDNVAPELSQRMMQLFDPKQSTNKVLTGEEKTTVLELIDQLSIVSKTKKCLKHTNDILEGGINGAIIGSVAERMLPLLTGNGTSLGTQTSLMALMFVGSASVAGMVYKGAEKISKTTTIDQIRNKIEKDEAIDMYELAQITATACHYHSDTRITELLTNIMTIVATVTNKIQGKESTGSVGHSDADAIAVAQRKFSQLFTELMDPKGNAKQKTEIDVSNKPFKQMTNRVNSNNFNIPSINNINQNSITFSNNDDSNSNTIQITNIERMKQPLLDKQTQ